MINTVRLMRNNSKILKETAEKIRENTAQTKKLLEANTSNFYKTLN